MRLKKPTRLNFDEHRPWLSRLALRLASDPHAAEDLAQDVWLRALENPPHWTRDGQDADGCETTVRSESVRSWLSVVTRNRATTKLRSRAAERLCPSFSDWTSEDEREERKTTASPVDEDLRAALHSALRTLPEDLRQLMHLRYEQDWTSTQIASHLETPVGTIRGRLQRSRQMVRARLLSAHKARLPEWAVARLRA